MSELVNGEANANNVRLSKESEQKWLQMCHYTQTQAIEIDRSRLARLEVSDKVWRKHVRYCNLANALQGLASVALFLLALKYLF